MQPPRFDDLNRSERYFTATLLPAILLHERFAGLTRFVALVDEQAERRPGGATAFTGVGVRVQRPRSAPRAFEPVELLAEFHITRDLTFAGQFPRAREGEGGEARERRDAPDLVLVLGDELLVCEAKFFSGWDVHGLNAQLRSQRQQVRYLFAVRPELRSYSHVAILPDMPGQDVDCSAVLTWRQIAQLAGAVLGPTHYVTQRLDRAVERYGSATEASGERNFDGLLSLAELLRLCRERGSGIEIGHDGGQLDLLTRDASYLWGKAWKWRDPQTNGGKTDRKNWMRGDQFLILVAPRVTEARHYAAAEAPPGVSRRKFEGEVLPLAAVLELCRAAGDDVWVGHSGGERDLRARGIGYAQQKAWKLRTPDTAGPVVWSNWIRGRRFSNVIADMERTG